jgi:DNA-binding response OmpR family regulator
VADDDPALRELLADYLGASGFVIDAVGDGAQMRQRMAGAMPDVLVLVDWFKGYERDASDRSIDVQVMRLLRRIEPDPARPVYIRTVRGEGIGEMNGLIGGRSAGQRRHAAGTGLRLNSHH